MESVAKNALLGIREVQMASKFEEKGTGAGNGESRPTWTVSLHSARSSAAVAYGRACQPASSGQHYMLHK